MEIAELTLEVVVEELEKRLAPSQGFAPCQGGDLTDSGG